VLASCRDPQAYTHALSDARCIFDMGVSFKRIKLIYFMYLLECWDLLVSTEGIRLWHEHLGYWWRIQWFWVSVATGTASM